MLGAETVSPVTAALIGAGGALLGGTLTAASSFLVEVQRSRRSDASAADLRKAKVRQSARLVLEELADAEQLLQDAATRRRYWPRPRALSAAVWTEQRGTLAEHIDSALSWRRITAGLDEINRLNWLVDQRRESTNPGSDAAKLGERVSPNDNTRQSWRAIREAIAQLEQVIEVVGPASRVLRDGGDIEAELWPLGDGSEFDGDDFDWYAGTYHD
jgi:hypothetical protein